MHKVNEAVKSDPLRLLVHLLSNILEKFLDHHCILELQLRETVVHQCSQVDAGPLDLHAREILQIPRRFLLLYHLLPRRLLLCGGFWGADGRFLVGGRVDGEIGCRGVRRACWRIGNYLFGAFLLLLGSCLDCLLLCGTFLLLGLGASLALFDFA